ncbi:MAG: hypothetical protein AMJ62_05155 [Myxococcales bacterium SG8_38]|nr:MAG: hypothetical protein AMJ62_05155 [Myxococcales bacterium SG8_38]
MHGVEICADEDLLASALPDAACPFGVEMRKERDAAPATSAAARGAARLQRIELRFPDGRQRRWQRGLGR